jgi:hypothetical protein
MRTAEETALLLALLIKRSGETRIRVSDKTVRRVAQRSYIRTAFLSMLSQHLQDLGLNMTELERGGYGLIRASVLEGAPAATAKNYLGDVLSQLKKSPSHIEKIRAEIEGDVGSSDEDE